uniref:Uncharacterized protein n=1 Tax=Panagrolaimus sp. JU765 TaxID=591449 RepID=A0AC34QL71_9BILA
MLCLKKPLPIRAQFGCLFVAFMVSITYAANGYYGYYYRTLEHFHDSDDIVLPLFLRDDTNVVIIGLSGNLIVLHQNAQVLMINFFIKVDNFTGIILDLIWTTAIMFSVCSMPIVFYYRYRMLCLKKPLPIRAQFGCLFVAFMVSITYAANGYYGYYYRTLEHFHDSDDIVLPLFLRDDTNVVIIGLSGNGDYKWECLKFEI